MDSQISTAERTTYTKEKLQAIYAQLNRIDAGELTAEARDDACKCIRELLKELKKNRSAAIGQITEELAAVEEIETRLKEIERQNKRAFRLLPLAPTNAQIDFQEKKLKHFAQGLSFYKLFWVFFIGCFAGVIVERIWCMLRYGFYEPRVGLIYGPFNLVYGLGALALTAALYPLRNRSKFFALIGGAVIGSLIEYFCSWFQEMVFGSVSWDYSNRPYNVNGRICLLYSVYWGALGVLWIKDLYPRTAKLILKIPNRVGKPLTLALAAFMVFNSLMTGLTVLRWVERRQGEPPATFIGRYCDEHYPNERMEAIFTNLIFNDERGGDPPPAAP